MALSPPQYEYVESVKEKVIGQKVIEFTAHSITLENGTVIRWSMEGSNGADGDWYQFLNIYVDNEKVAHI